MVRDSVLWHCYSPGGHGKPEWGNSLHSSSSAQAFWILFYMSAHIYTVLLSTCRENTHSVGRTQKTIFISCKQTHLFMTRIRRPVLLPVRWARTHTYSRRRTITVATGIFIGPVSCGRHDRELTHVSEQSVSQRRESALTQGSCHFVPTQALRDREICLWFCLIAQTECVCRHFFVVTTCLSVWRGFSATLQPPTRSHTIQTSVIIRVVLPWMSTPKVILAAV